MRPAGDQAARGLARHGRPAAQAAAVLPHGRVQQRHPFARGQVRPGGGWRRAGISGGLGGLGWGCAAGGAVGRRRTATAIPARPARPPTQSPRRPGTGGPWPPAAPPRSPGREPTTPSSGPSAAGGLRRSAIIRCCGDVFSRPARDRQRDARGRAVDQPAGGPRMAFGPGHDYLDAVLPGRAGRPAPAAPPPGSGGADPGHAARVRADLRLQQHGQLQRIQRQPARGQPAQRIHRERRRPAAAHRGRHVVRADPGHRGERARPARVGLQRARRADDHAGRPARPPRHAARRRAPRPAGAPAPPAGPPRAGPRAHRRRRRPAPGLPSATGTTQPGSTGSPAVSARASTRRLGRPAAGRPRPSRRSGSRPEQASGAAAAPRAHPTDDDLVEAYDDSSSCPSSVTSSISSSRTPNSCTFPCWVSSANTMPGRISSG